MCRQSWFVLLVLFLYPTASHAQWIPDHIPDTPDKSPADRERDRFTERHRAELSRLFFIGDAFSAPLFTYRGTVYDVTVGIGAETSPGKAVLVAAGMRTIPAVPGGAFDDHRSMRDVSTFMLGYETRLLNGASRLAEHVALRMQVGALIGDISVLSAQFAPRYVFEPHPYWNVPVGITVAAVFGPHRSGMERLSIGLSAGVQIRFAQYHVLK